MHLFGKVNEKIISIKSVRNDDKIQIVEFGRTELKIEYPSSVQTSFRNDGQHGS